MRSWTCADGLLTVTKRSLLFLMSAMSCCVARISMNLRKSSCADAKRNKKKHTKAQCNADRFKLLVGKGWAGKGARRADTNTRRPKRQGSCTQTLRNPGLARMTALTTGYVNGERGREVRRSKKRKKPAVLPQTKRGCWSCDSH